MSTQVFFPERHIRHQPKEDLSDGLPPCPHPETAARIDAVISALKTLPDMEFRSESALAEEAVRRLHDADYVDFLMAVSQELDSNEALIPTIFRPDLSRAPLRFQAGMYCNEIGTPIVQGSIEAALNSAATALSAAQSLKDTLSDTFALCRPPGHHAGKRRYGGYCYFNNAYLAARQLAGDARCCPVLDIDYHIGDGSIEFASNQTPYLSLHADPWRNYPYLDSAFTSDPNWSHLDILEYGAGKDRYLEKLSGLLDRLKAYEADYLVLSLGLDTLNSDDIQDAPVTLSLDDYTKIGACIGAAIDAPILILLEGGYDLEHLGTAILRFWEGLRSSRPAS